MRYYVLIPSPTICYLMCLFGLSLTPIALHPLEATESGIDFSVEVAVWGAVMANE